jgi:hypothetical protein
MGDPVDLSGGADSTGKYKQITHATLGAGNAIYGVIIGFEVAKQDDPLSYNYGKASTERYPIVVDDPDVIFKIQDNGDDTPVAGDVGSNANLAVPSSLSGDGDTTYGTSACELDGSTLGSTDATYQLFVYGLDNSENNELAANADWLVLINLHRLKASYDSTDSAWNGALGV